jgi:methylenetetrahydrofolate reductase (NADPH)
MTGFPTSGDATFRDRLEGPGFPCGVEIVTGRGIAPPEGSPGPAAFARDLLADPRVAWVSVTDNAGGGPMLPPDWLARQVADHRGRVVVHLTCKDRNRNALEAAAWRYASEGFDNILALTGDYPTAGFRGLPTPVFDLDSVGLIVMLRAMNDGLAAADRRGRPATLPPTRFFIGCTVSPFKRFERELMPQYFKLARKIAAGARWVIPQLGYDMRKFHEVKLVLASRGLDVPVVGNVYLLGRGAARMFHAGKLAGCVLNDALLELCEKQAAAADKGRAFFEELAARQLAVFKGLGFAGGYLGGVADVETVGRILDRAESFAPDDWRQFYGEIQFAQPGEFFLFERDPATGLGDPGRVNPEYLRALEKPPRSREVTLGYRLSRLVHRWFFTPGKGFWPLMARLYRRWDRRPGRLARLAYAVERGSNATLYGCVDCGDCSLPDCAYLCPRHACSKNGRNGPCGGSASGRCELDDKECFWARVYQRLRAYGESKGMFEGPVTFYNAELEHTSSWANTYLERDHHAGAGGPSVSGLAGLNDGGRAGGSTKEWTGGQPQTKPPGRP